MKRGPLIVLAIVLGGALAVWLAMPEIPKPHPKASHPADAETAPPEAATTPTPAPEPDLAGSAPARELALHVVGCQRRGAAQVDVTVKVDDTGKVVTTRTDADGRARVRLAVGVAARVSVRAGVLVGERVAAPDAATLELEVCPGAKVGGRIIDGLGNALSGIGVTLVGAEGARVDGARSDRAGHYEVQDADVVGATLVLDVAPGLQKRFPLAPPLAPKEARTMDLVAVGGRDVRGFVLDLEGNPVAGVKVTVGTPKIEAMWTLVSDAGGMFRLPSAPSETIIIAADGQDLGTATATLPASDRPASVDLVLAPSAVLTVSAPDRAGAKMIVTLTDPEIFTPSDADPDLFRPMFREGGIALSDTDTRHELWERLHARIRALPEARLRKVEMLMDSMRLEDVDETHTGFLQSVLSGFDWDVQAAEGVVGQPITLPAGVWYRVTIAGAAGEPARACGEVHLHAGSETTLVCAHGDVTLAGQVIDEGGRPLRTDVELTIAGAKITASTDERGRFRVTTAVEGAAVADLAVLAGGAAAPQIVRRNIVAAAGTSRDLGRVVVRAPLAPGGVDVGAALSEDRYGFAVEQVTRDSTLELAGVDPGDRIVEIDGDDAIELPLADALARLGRPGAPPLLRIRTSNGELYDLELAP